MSTSGKIFRLTVPCALLSALLVALPLQAAETATGYEGWAFSSSDQSAMARAFSLNRGTGLAVGDTVAAAGADGSLGLQLTRAFNNGLALDAGITHTQERLEQALSPVDYQDAFLGFRYNHLSGQVWYMDDYDAGSSRSLYYQAGWKAPVTERFSLSLQMGQAYREGRFQNPYPDLSIAAEGEIQGYGLGVRLIDRSGLGLGNDNGYSLMGSISKRFP